MKTGTTALKQQTASVNIEDVDELVDDMQEANDLQTEINEALGQDFVQLDEDDLEAELAELEELEADSMFEDMPDITAPPQQQQNTNIGMLADMPVPPQQQTQVARDK